MNPDSALLVRETPVRVKAAISALLALLLVIAGAITAPTAFGAGQSLSAPEVPRAGGTITVSGTGYSTTSPGIYLGLRLEGATNDTYTVWIDVENAVGDLPGLGATAPMNADGSFAVSIPVPAYTEGVSYTLFSRKAHGIPDPSQNLTQPLVYEAAPVTATSTALSASPEGTAVEGADVALTATVTPAADGSVVFRSGSTELGTVAAAAGSASLTTNALAGGAASLTAQFVPADGAAFTGSTSAALAYTVTAATTEPEPPAPKVSVSKSVGLARGGEVITVTGTGFTPSPPATDGARAPLSGVFAGSYVVFGKFLGAWQPSAGAPSSARTVIVQKWGVAAAQFGGSVNAGNGGFVIAADGSFSVDIEVSASEANDLRAGNYGIYTYAGSGAVYAPFETFTPLTFTPPAPTFEPAIQVYLADGVTPVGSTPVREGDQLVVKGTGFDPAANVGGSGLPIPATLPQGTFVVFGSFADSWRPSEGNPSTSRVMNGAARQWALAESVLDQVPPAFQSTIRSAWAPISADGSFTATVSVVAPANPLADGNWGIYTYPGGVGTPANPAQELSVPVNYGGVEPTGPSIDVTVTDASAEDGATVRVVGSRFGDATGAYAAVIEKGTEDKVSADDGYVVFGFWMTPGAIVGGAFDKTLVAPTDRLDRAKQYEVIVWQGHTLPDSTTIYARADVPISAAQWDVLAPVDTPRVIVSKTTGLDPEGETITVRGSGFVPNAPTTSGTRPPLFGVFAGAYVVFGSFESDWRPSAGAPSSARKGFDTKWGVHAASVEAIGGASNGAIVIQPDGTFETTLTAAQAADALAGGKWGVYTYAGGGAVYAPFETFTPVTFQTVTPPVTNPPTPPTPPVAGGSLKWAISSSFSSYVTGPIAHGAISLGGGATRANGVFQFGQIAGSTYDPATGIGSAGYGGSVRFTGHAGALDVTIANPQVRISSASSASLYVTSGGSQVNFATLNLAAATRTTSAGAVTYTAVPATLTAAGRDQVLAGFTTTLDPVTFTIGSAAAAPTGSTGTVAAAPVAETSSAIPATPPATDGIEATPEQLAALGAGLPATVSASGFQANEQDIKVVVYSTPIVLGTVNADAAGVVTWTGSMPATLADGEHTLTFQGSVARGIPFTLARAAAATDGCVVAAASLRWGFKESFRVYIEGIAAGGWELTDVAYEYPEYVWTSGEGTVDAATRTGLVTYGGSIRFTGHDGALDTTLANARVELAGDVGYLVFDITGTTQEGEPVTASGVRFAEFALPDLELTTDGLVLDALPATLTEAGAEAFGTYPAGEDLDPVSAVLPVGADCGAVAVVDDEPEAVAVVPISDDAADEAAPVWPWFLGGIAVALVIGAVVWIVAARRRSTTAAAGAGSTSGADAD